MDWQVLVELRRGESVHREQVVLGDMLVHDADIVAAGAAHAGHVPGIDDFEFTLGEHPRRFGHLAGGLIDGGPARYGVNFISERSTFQSGEAGGWSTLNVAKVCIMQAPPLYHTTGEVFEVISTPGLERVARFLANFVKEVGKAPVAKINP